MTAITIEIKAEALAAAITALANALTARNAPAAQVTAPVNPTPTAAPSFAAAPTIPTAQPAPAAAHVPVAPAPIATTPLPAIPAADPAPPPVVPTAAAPTYTTEQLAVAATQLVDAGRRAELVELLKAFGVPALTKLPKEQYGAFATALRGMGAKL